VQPGKEVHGKTTKEESGPWANRNWGGKLLVNGEKKKTPDWCFKCVTGHTVVAGIKEGTGT